MMCEFSGHSIMVTGAGKGLGRSIAQLLARNGATVGLVDVDAAACQETQRSITGEGGHARAYTVDASKRQALMDAAADFSNSTGQIDAIVNNAAVLVYEPIETVTEETLDRMIGAGFKSVAWGTQALLRHMNHERGAAIVNFSSPVAFRGYPRSAIYSSVKGAVTSMTRVLAAELGPRNVRVNAVSPGSIPTPGAMIYVTQEEYARRAQTNIPLRRLGTEGDVANAVAFLLSKHASFITGAILAVDGGIAAAA